MSSKTFKNVRKPARKPTAEEISGFEATGRAGRKLDPALATEAQESVSTEMREHGKAESRQPLSPEIPETINTEISIPVEPVVRLTIDLPENAHLRFKAACALSRRTMVQEVRDFIERRTVELEDRRRLN